MEGVFIQAIGKFQIYFVQLRIAPQNPKTPCISESVLNLVAALALLSGLRLNHLGSLLDLSEVFVSWINLEILLGLPGFETLIIAAASLFVFTSSFLVH